VRLQHYVINLERRPERLWAWLGAQDRIGFPVEEVTVFYGVDAHAFGSIGEVIQYAKQHGLIDLPDKDPSDASFTLFGTTGLRLSYDFLLRKIAGLDSKTWYVIWLDDMALRNVSQHPYEDFKNILFNVPSDAKIIQVFSDGNNVLEKHSQSPFLYGTTGRGFDHCIVVSPEGAERLIQIGELANLFPYDAIATKFWQGEYPDKDMSGIYTLGGDNRIDTIFTDEMYSDIWVEQRKNWRGDTKLKTLSVEDIFHDFNHR